MKRIKTGLTGFILGGLVGNALQGKRKRDI